ncbi:integral membrane protein [Xylariaceae sp. FL0016]|nr:integral membrane protein [Xylariaceae sp. FL0016]
MAISPTRPEPLPTGSPEWEAWAAEDKGPQILITCWTVISLATLFVIARFYLSTALSTLSVSYGDGKHFSILTIAQQQGSILWTTVGFCPGVMSFGLPKLAVVVLLRRLLVPGRLHGAFLWFLGIFTQLVLFATVGVLIGRCYPARAQWDFSITEKTCFSTHILASYYIFAGAWSAFVDFYLAFYPAIVLSKLQMTLKKKLAFSLALGIGSVSGVVAAYKTSQLYLLQSPDFSYDTSDLVIWTVIEGSTIIIASSIPLLQPLSETIFGRRFFSTKGSKNRQYYQDYSDATGVSKNLTIGSLPTRMKLTPYDDLKIPVLGSFKGSQEEILIPMERQVARASGGSNNFMRTQDGSGILATTEVSIRYDRMKVRA